MCALNVVKGMKLNMGKEFVEYKGKTYLFYNGNNYGYDGFGYAELLNEQ